jgi:putative ABC transport system permease protein
VAERLPGMVVTPNFFSALGVQPIMGRNFLPSEGVFGTPRVALLTYGFWQAHFGGERDVTSQSMVLDGRPVSIVGVLPANFQYPNSRDDRSRSAVGSATRVATVSWKIGV